MRFLSSETVGVMIDMQGKLAPHIAGIDEVVKNQTKLIQGLQALEIPILATEQYKKGLGETLPELKELLDPKKTEPVEKMSFSCTDDEGFREQLARTGRDHVVIFGIEAHVCVLQTVLDLLEDAFEVIVVKDCVSSRYPADMETALRRMEQEGAMLTTSESILFELCRVAGTDVFKQISKLVK